MTPLDKIERELRARKPDLFRRFHIKRMALFGSSTRNEARADSDVDILVEFAGPVGIEFVDLANDLELILKRRVDLVSRKAVQPKYFEQIADDLRYV
jgi:predicted nucleotidyltransferase